MTWTQFLQSFRKGTTDRLTHATRQQSSRAAVSTAPTYQLDEFGEPDVAPTQKRWPLPLSRESLKVRIILRYCPSS